MYHLHSRFALPPRLKHGPIALAVAAAAISLAWSVAGALHMPALPEENTPTTDETPTPGTAAAMPWFGATGDTLAASGPLELKGISQSDDPSLQGAFIALAGGVESYYRPGDSLPGGSGTLESVHTDYITYRNGENTHTLAFAGASPAVAPLPAEAPPPTAMDRHPASPIPLVAQFQANPEELLAQAGLTAVEQYKDSGYRYSGTDGLKIFSPIDLRKDDIILSVNNQPVGDANNDRLRVADLADSAMLTLKIKRGNDTIDMQYQTGLRDTAKP
ncbi:MAG: hypothetical protein K2Q01_11815 [Rickettsiales bacterium]|nr:hypothetical protein [Rickettsiales bacterium]